MLEDFIIELDKPTKAIKILAYFIQELIYNNFDFDECENPRLKRQYIKSLIYTIELVNKDILKLKREYYKLMCKEKYGQ